MTKKRQNILIGAVIAAFISGCAMLGPNYKPVKPDAPAAWQTAMTGSLQPGQVDRTVLSRWWTVFNDPLLAELEGEALHGNLDIKTAMSRVREARALMGINRAGLFPSINTSAAASKSRDSFSFTGSGESNLYNVGFDAGWELDIFGGKKRALEAAKADLAARREALHEVLVSLSAEIGINYVDVRTYQARLKTARNNLAAQKQALALNQSRYQTGLIDDLALQQSRYNMELTRSHIPQLRTALSAAMNRLAILLGQKPGSLNRRLTKIAPVPAAPPEITVGVPAEALRRRPDIRRAERQLAAQTARIGVAKADLYPKFKLAGSIGLESLHLKDLPEWTSRLFRIGPSVSWNIFDAGAIRQNIVVQNARQEQAMLHYKATVLNALEEVENTLTAFVQEETRKQALTRAAKAAGKAEQTAADRYQAGLTDFSNVLKARRSLFSFNDELAQSTGAVTTDLIRLYKALGGGWSSGVLPTTTGGRSVDR
ncbi:MAG: efflux transporter outer membrane subunit [Deltaproteobacteria bacterium]|nr:efflux transporter outer membrane subunit [Deltaproteobacteria bacterium]